MIFYINATGACIVGRLGRSFFGHLIVRRLATCSTLVVVIWVATAICSLGLQCNVSSDEARASADV